jgi:hypothetical protein
VTPPDEYNQNHSEAKLTRQVKAIKDNFGMGSILGTVSLLVSIIVAVIVIGTPVYKQGEASGTTTKAVEVLTTAQREMREESVRFNVDILNRIEALGKQTLESTQEMRAEMRSMRQTTDGAFVELRQDTKGLWKWATSIDGRVGVLEAEIKQKK